MLNVRKPPTIRYLTITLSIVKLQYELWATFITA